MMCCPNCCSAEQRPVTVVVNDATDPDAVVAAIRKYIGRP